jgi:hypothetical protein
MDRHWRESLANREGASSQSTLAAIDGLANLLNDDLANAEQRINAEGQAEIAAIRKDVEQWRKLATENTADSIRPDSIKD